MHELIKIIPMTMEHAELIVKWRNNPLILESLFSSEKITLESHTKWFERYIIGTDRKEFIIYHVGSDKAVGTIGLSNIDIVNSKAEYGIIIGEDEFRGRGIAKAASMLILEHGFNILGLNKIYLKVLINNKDAIGLYKKLGFTQEGLLRQDIYKNGTFKDVVIMSLLKSDFLSE